MPCRQPKLVCFDVFRPASHESAASETGICKHVSTISNQKHATNIAEAGV